MLTLIGLGLFDEKDLTIRAIEKARNAEKLYIELYTSIWHGSLQRLEELVGKKVQPLQRKDLEESSSKILAEAQEKDIVIFVQGDPLIQTTHSSLILDARKRGIEVELVHNASIISAVGETGLHPQKFGPYITIPLPEKTKGNLPESVYEIIKMNKARGLHTLCLLDLDTEHNNFMSVSEGIKILLEIEEKRREGILTPDSEIIVFSRAGSNKPLIVYSKVKEILERDLKELPSVLIIPGILHFTEREFLAHFKS